MSIYDLIVRILMLKMIIVQQKIDLQRLMKFLLIILSLILAVVVGFLILIVIMNKQRYIEVDCKRLSKQNSPEEVKLNKLDWWEHSVIYQVYLRSFKDSNGDGIGDLKGLTSKLEHFIDAGIDVIWLSSIFTSSMIDFRYDVSNFYDIHHEYGTMADFEDMLEKAHSLGIKVLLDYMPSHASTDSRYFKLSEIRAPGYENYFVWEDPRRGPGNSISAPSNEISEYGDSIWEWSVIRQQYYLHQFTKTQADFNFREPAVRRELKTILEFWLEKGVDGFHLPLGSFEASAHNKGLFPDVSFSGNMFASQHTIRYTNNIHTKDLEEIYDLVYEWRGFVDRWQNETGGETRILIAEAHTNISNTMLYYGDDRNRSGVHFPLNFDFIDKLSDQSSARDFVYIINHWLIYMPHGRVANWVLGNHDTSRIATSFSPKMVDGLNALTMMLPGVACIYQGDEIGMKDGDVSLELRNKLNYTKYTWDPARTPFHWDDTSSAGFSKNDSTWLPVDPDYEKNNLKAQKKADRSHFKVYQSLTKLRKEPALSHGSYHIQAISESTLVLIRYLDSFDGYALVFNVGKKDDEVDLTREVLLKEPLDVYMSSVHSERRIGDVIPLGRQTLQPGEALILCLKMNRS